MNVVNKLVKELIPYEQNTKKHDSKQIANVAESIKQYGFVQPLVIDVNNVVVIGHCRLLAAKKLKMKEAPCVCVDDLTEEQVRALRIVDNKSNESEWDLDFLELELPEVDLSAFDFDFSFDDINGKTADDVEEDNFEVELPEEPKAKRGDIYQLGKHRLMCGDSTNADDVSKLMNGEKANVVFTDPPYGYNYQSNKREKTSKFDVIENDDKILDFFPNIKNVCDGFVFICTAWKVLDKWIPLFKKYHELTNMIIWNKGGGGIGDLKHTFFTDYEVILCASNGKEITGKRIGSVWDIGKDNANSYVHPTQKPIGLAALAISETTNYEGSVLDLFGGSGSTLIAAEQLSRKCFMMEYDPKYVDVIIQRWEQFTGERAVLLND